MKEFKVMLSYAERGLIKDCIKQVKISHPQYYEYHKKYLELILRRLNQKEK